MHTEILTLPLAQVNRLARLTVVIHDAFDAVIMYDPEGKVLAWNPGAERIYGWTETEAIQLTVRERMPAAFIDVWLGRLKQLCQLNVMGPLESQRLTRSGAEVTVALVATALLDAKGEVYAISATERLL